MMSSPTRYAATAVALFLLVASTVVFAGNFHRDFDITWGDRRARVLDKGRDLALSLDLAGGSSIQSKDQYLFGKFDVQMKLVAGNSAGTVASFYLSSLGPIHDEIDFEFLGNLSGDPYVLHTNVFSRGSGGREQQFYLWFDPTADFHTYSIIWTPRRIILSVDETPVREFKNLESVGVPFPSKQAMGVYASIWNAEYWATRGGLVKTNWTEAPFTAFYRNFRAEACVWSSEKNPNSSCGPHFASASEIDEWLGENEWDLMVEESIKWVQENYMIYNYCADIKNHPHGLPAECVASNSRKRDLASF